MQTGRRGVAFGNEQWAVLGSVFGRNGEEAAGCFASLEKELVRTFGKLVRQDELQALDFAGRVQHGNNKPSVLCLPQADGRDFLSFQIGMVVPGGSGAVPDTRGQFGGSSPAALLFGFVVRFDGPDAFMQGSALGGGQFLFRPVCPRSLIAGAPVLPPEGSRSIQKRRICAVLSVGSVRCAATVQEAVGQNGIDLQPSCTQTLGKAVQNVGAHFGLQV